MGVSISIILWMSTTVMGLHPTKYQLLLGIIYTIWVDKGGYLFTWYTWAFLKIEINSAWYVEHTQRERWSLKELFIIRVMNLANRSKSSNLNLRNGLIFRSF